MMYLSNFLKFRTFWNVQQQLVHQKSTKNKILATGAGGQIKLTVEDVWMIFNANTRKVIKHFGARGSGLENSLNRPPGRVVGNFYLPSLNFTCPQNF